MDRSAHDVDCHTCGYYRVGMLRETRAAPLGLPDRAMLLSRIANANGRGMRLDISNGEQIPLDIHG